MDYTVIDITTYSQAYALPIKAAYLPGFSLHAYLVKDTKQSDTAITQLQNVRSKMETIEQSMYGSQDDHPCYILFDFARPYCWVP